MSPFALLMRRNQSLAGKFKLFYGAPIGTAQPSLQPFIIVMIEQVRWYALPHVEWLVLCMHSLSYHPDRYWRKKLRLDSRRSLR
jgi:hypothetical protein